MLTALDFSGLDLGVKSINEFQVELKIKKSALEIDDLFASIFGSAFMVLTK